MSAQRNPADEPRTIAHAEVRWFGVAPPIFLLGLTAVAFAAAVALLASGGWPYGLIFLGLTALLVAAYLEVAKRRPDSALTRASADAAVGARERGRATIEVLRARSSGLAARQRVRSARAVIEAERRAMLLRLGEAMQREDETSVREIRERLAELDRTEAQLGETLAARLVETEERLRRARLPVQQTMIVRPDGELTPPQPPAMPEPYPPPDEGTPPTPAPVPEPSPDPKPDEEEDRRSAA